ncbi:MAG TPA: DivIVA domain-containing protein [Acidimicrobiales bacterium]|nr:DivIVA domain-containing protein [Acidimicrobiales bacterium]
MAPLDPRDRRLVGPEAALASVNPEDVARRRFSTSFRGFDQHEVRVYLNQIADELARLRARQDELQRELGAAAQAPPPAMDRESLMAALGEETARIVRTAEEAAGDIRSKAEEAAARLRSEAAADSEAMRGEAAVILDQRREQAQAEAAEITRRAEEEAQRLLDDAAWRGQEMIREAEASRDEVLADLAERKRVAHLQVERLGAGRDRLLEAYRAVRQNLDEAVSTLDHAPEEARKAAEAAESLARRTRPERPAPLRPAPPPHPEPAPELEPEPVAETPPAPEAEPEPVAETPPAPEPEPVPPHVEPITEPEPAPAREPAADPEPVAEPEPVPAREPGPEPEPLNPVAAAADDVFARIRAERAVPSVDYLERRDSALDPLVSPFVRKLKRRLQDEQNDVLDRIRSGKGLPSLDEALGAIEQQTARYESIAGDPLEAAANSGAESVGGAGRTEAVAPLCAGLAAELARPLRRGVGRALNAAAGADDQQAVADGVGAAYREWRSTRLENLVTEHLAAAYVAGVHGASAGDLVWVFDDGGDPCPDCEDNALAGPTSPKEPFPTGQLLPPAHPGCRCLLAPAEAGA